MIASLCAFLSLAVTPSPVSPLLVPPLHPAQDKDGDQDKPKVKGKIPGPDEGEEPDKAADASGFSTADQKAKLHPVVLGSPAVVKADALTKRRSLQADSPFAAIKWSCFGPVGQGSRVVNIVIPKGDPNKIYVAYATSGLWVSDNGGRSFKSIFDNQGTYGIGDIAISNDGKDIWVGTGENNSQRTSYAGIGIYVSHDSGATWQFKGLPESQHIGRILINPQNPKEVYVGVIGHLYSQNPERGVYKTTDGGDTWNQVLATGDWAGVIDMAMDPRDPKVLYACAWERDRRAWDILESGAGSGIYKSTNSGATWHKVPGLPSGDDMGRPGIAISQSDPDKIYVFLENRSNAMFDRDETQPDGVMTLLRFQHMDPAALKKVDPAVLKTFLSRYLPMKEDAAKDLADVQSGKLDKEHLSALFVQRDAKVFKSPGEKGAECWISGDSGASWRLTRPYMGQIGGYYWNRVFVNPVNSQDLYVCGVPLMRSTDGGVNWDSVAEDIHVDYHVVAFDPKDPQRVWSGEDGGLGVTDDDGKTWSAVNTIPVGQYTTLALDSKKPFNVYGGLQDNGTIRVESDNNPHDGDQGDKVKNITGGDGSAIAVDPRDDGDTVYTSWQFGSFVRTEQSTGKFEQVQPQGAGNRWNWISPIAISPFDADIVYVGAQYVFRSFDKGHSWTKISPDLTLGSHPGNVPFGTLTQLSLSPLKFERIYAGADDGTVQTTGDGGVTWQKINTPAANKWVIRVVASKYKEGRVYVAQNGYREDDWKPYLWQSDDYGKTWKSIVGNLPSESVNTIREDPDQADVLYAGTDMGVYVSLDSGASWTAFGSGLPDTPIHDIQIQARDHVMVAASHGRTIWQAPINLVGKTKAFLSSAKALDLDGVSTVPSGPMRHPPYSWQSDEFRGQHLTIWSKADGNAEISVTPKGDHGRQFENVHLHRGVNFVDLSLLWAPGSSDPVYRVPSDPADPKQALQDPYAGARAYYPPAGDYVLTVTMGKDKVEANFKVGG